ncbi:MAG TPA: SpoIIE family protein phosphatase [Polyangiaceae bacterium]
MDPRKSTPRRPATAFLIDYFDGDYQLGLMRGAEDAARAQDEDLIVAVGRWLKAPNPVDAVQNDVFHHLKQPGVSGVAIAAGCLSHYVSAAELSQFCASFAPLPVVSISVEIPSIPSLLVDNRRGQSRIIDHLIEVHHRRRIAYIRGPVHSVEAGQRFDGYRDSLESHGLAFDPDLVLTGDFRINSGADALGSLVDRGIDFDSLATANDYMALGAMDALKGRGIAVPGTIGVVGFDDIPSARMTLPALTTVRQPLQKMGKCAVEILRKQRDAQPIVELQSFDVELVRRQSCGCGYRIGNVGLAARGPHLEPLSLPELLSRRSELVRRLLEVVTVDTGSWPVTFDGLIAALAEEFAGQRGRFLAALTEALERARARLDVLEQFYGIISALRSELRQNTSPEWSRATLDDLWHASILLVGEWVNRVQMRVVFEQERSNDSLRGSVERLSTALTHASLGEAIDAIIPSTAIASACFGLYQSNAHEELKVLSAIGAAENADLRGSSYKPEALVPDGLLRTDQRSTFILMPLSHGGTLFGQAIFRAGEHRSVYAMLREQIGAALKAAELHRAVVDETSQRERAERERLERETEIAQQIQTAILPVAFEVPGLSLAALMKPAISVGGDYYDVIPIQGGCFLGIGDVTGHGLLAGMIMLMVQSMIAAAIRIDEHMTPSELLPPINQALYDNVRHRLCGTDHVTLTLIKYRYDGKLVLAGAHEDILICRKRTRRCERIVSSGFWLAAVADITEMTTDVEAQLYDGDVLVLYTDGVTEAMNESREQFGTQRLIATIERHAEASPDDLCRAILAACNGWSSTQNDDVSLVIARYSSAT